MKIINQIDVTDAMLTSSTIAEDDYAVWNGATTYAVGDFVISTTTHRIYRSLTADNLGNDPVAQFEALNDPLVADPSVINWQDFAATDRWKLFDIKPTQRATDDDNITVSFTPSQFIGACAGFGISANTVTVSMAEGATEIYSKTIAMQDDSAVIDWYTYFFEPIEELEEFVVTDLPTSRDAVLTVSIDRDGSTVSVGQVLFGPLWESGLTTSDGSGFTGFDFSEVVTDAFGNLTRTVRSASRLNEFSVFLNADRLSTFKRRMNALRGGKPAVWIGDPKRGKAAITYGILRNYRVAYETNQYSLIALETQELV